MKSKLLIVVFIAILLYSAQVAPLMSYCQDDEPPAEPRQQPPFSVTTPIPTEEPTSSPTPSPTLKPAPTPEPEKTPWWSKPTQPTPASAEGAPNFLFIGEVVVGVVAVAGVGISAFVVVKKRKVSEKSLRRLSSSEFQGWVLKRLDGKSSSSRDSAIGIDGFTKSGQPVLIKQSDDIGMSVIEKFASALARNKTRQGVIVAFSFGSDAIRGKVRAKMNYGLEIQMLTVNELVYGKRAF